MPLSVQRRVLLPLICALLGACAHTANRLGTEAPADLVLNRLYKNPVGDYGLEPTPELLNLAGKRVRAVGFMVGEQDPVPGQFKLTLLPVQLAEREDGPADDLPAATVFVHLDAGSAQRIVKFQPHPIAVIGTLEVGYREEPDGRVSNLRLLLDPDKSHGVM